jgi:hypothetical protein
VQEVVTGLEKEIYFRNKFKANCKTNYESDIKLMASFLKRDKNGSVSLKLMSGALLLNQAALLKFNFNFITRELKIG